MDRFKDSENLSQSQGIDMNNNTSMSVGSATEYEDLIAEIKFGSVAGVILSKEPGDEDYMVSLHSFSTNAAANFDYARNVSEDKIRLDDFLTALAEAKSRMERLG